MKAWRYLAEVVHLTYLAIKGYIVSIRSCGKICAVTPVGSALALKVTSELKSTPPRHLDEGMEADLYP